MTIIESYESEDVEHLAHLLALVRIALVAKPCDFLGMVFFMNQERGDKDRGQFFPLVRGIHYSQASALRAVATFVDSAVCEDRRAGLCCRSHVDRCGSRDAGVGVCAFTVICLWVSCVDIDVVAMPMAYIQLSSPGIPGEIVLGNTLADERRFCILRCIG